MKLTDRPCPHRAHVLGAILAVACSFASLAQADCVVSNETRLGARLEIGRTRWRVEPGAASPIRPGAIRVRTDDGRRTSGRCKEAERLELLDEGGGLRLVVVRPA